MFAIAASTSCSKKSFEAISVTIRDTLVITDTRILHDTIEVFKDTILYQDKIRVELKYLDRVVKVKAECLPDTIRITQTKVVSQEVVHKNEHNSFGKVVNVTLAFVILSLVLSIVYRLLTTKY